MSKTSQYNQRSIFIVYHCIKDLLLILRRVTKKTVNTIIAAGMAARFSPHESPHFFTTALAALGAGFVEDLVQSKLEHGRGEGGSVGRASDQSTVVRQCGVWA